jgi:hypothetical protein
MSVFFHAYSVNSYADLATFTSDLTSANNETVNIVTIKGNVSINTTPDDMRKIMVFSSRINITQDINLNKTVHISNIHHSKKKVNTVENINAIVTENRTRLDNITTITNARYTTELTITELNNTMDDITLNTCINFNSSIVNVTNFEKNNFIMHPTARQNKTESTNSTSNSIISSISTEYSITENSSHLDNINLNSSTHPDNFRNSNSASENIGSVTQQIKTTYGSTFFHISKITDTTDTNVNNNINTITDTEANTGDQTTTVTNTPQQNVNIKTSTGASEETIPKTDMTIHESTSDTIFTESYTASAIITENENEWIFTEEEDDGSIIIPEMPSIASDPMALKELPRPMIFEDEAGRGLV